VLPIEAKRADVLAAHANSVRAIVDADPVPIDADLMDTLANLGAIIHFGAAYETIDVGAARRLGIGVVTRPMRRFGAAERYGRAAVGRSMGHTQSGMT
jgi:lactate dehydrogenase-like 2-hydroxyacid dehydrogenase